MKLVFATATIQTRRSRPSRFLKLLDKSDLLESVQACDDFCIVKNRDADIQTKISEDMGVGLSILVTDHFFKIDNSTLAKIQRTHGSKPDIQCITLQNMKVTIEAKGATSKRSRKRQKTAAIRQKNGPVRTDVNIASCALLNEHSISDVDFSDPPLIPVDNIRYEKALLKADHYTRVFNLIGQEELSVYFALMRKRIINDRDFEEFKYKQRLYDKIKGHYLSLRMGQATYKGEVEEAVDGSFMFLGIDERLLNAYSFVDFQGSDEGHIEDEEDNIYVFSDGICIAFLKSIRLFHGQIRRDQIPHHFDAFSISDFDYSKEKTIIRYLSHIVKKLGGQTEYVGMSKDFAFDVLVQMAGQQYGIEIKRFLNYRTIKRFIFKAKKVAATSKYKMILLTNVRVNEDLNNEFNALGFKVIDRDALQEIITNNETLLKFLK